MHILSQNKSAVHNWQYAEELVTTVKYTPFPVKYFRIANYLPFALSSIPFQFRGPVQCHCPYQDRGNQEMISMVLYPEPVFRQTHQSR